MCQTISGIDVSKHELFIYVNESYFSIKNDKKSLTSWFKQNKALVSTVDKFVYEPTGGYEKALAEFLEAHEYPGYRVHANHVRNYAKAVGILAKTDKIDAKVIADFAQLPTTRLTASNTHDRHFTALVSRREQLLEMHKQENSRLETLGDTFTRGLIKRHMMSLKGEIATIDDALKEAVGNNTEYTELVTLLNSIPGVGFITAVSIIAYLPEVFSTQGKSLAALAGLAPMNKDSGQRTGKRRIQGGRSQLRRILYMASVTAKRYNPDLKAFYDRLTAKGKAYKVAMTAVMRKLLLIIISVAQRGTPWQKNPPKVLAF